MYASQDEEDVEEQDDDDDPPVSRKGKVRVKDQNLAV